MVSQIVQRKIENEVVESVLLVFLISTIATLGEVGHSFISRIAGTSYTESQGMRQPS